MTTEKEAWSIKQVLMTKDDELEWHYGNGTIKEIPEGETWESQTTDNESDPNRIYKIHEGPCKLSYTVSCQYRRCNVVTGTIKVTKGFELGDDGYPADWPAWIEKPPIPQGYKFKRLGHPALDEEYLRLYDKDHPVWSWKGGDWSWQRVIVEKDHVKNVTDTNHKVEEILGISEAEWEVLQEAGWVRHGGKGMPVDKWLLDNIDDMDLLLRSGDETNAGGAWVHDGGPRDILAYRAPSRQTLEEGFAPIEMDITDTDPEQEAVLDAIKRWRAWCASYKVDYGDGSGVQKELNIVEFVEKKLQDMYTSTLSGPCLAKDVTRNPLGILTKEAYDAGRRNDLADAIQRYTDAGKDVPAEWIKEYQDLAVAANELKVTDTETERAALAVVNNHHYDATLYMDKGKYFVDLGFNSDKSCLPEMVVDQLAGDLLDLTRQADEHQRYGRIVEH